MQLSPILAVAVLALTSTAIANRDGLAAEPARALRAVQPRQTTDMSGGDDNGQPDNLLSSLLNLANEFDLTLCLPGALGLVGELPPIPSGLVDNDVITQVLAQTTLPADQICSFSITGRGGEMVTSFLPTWYSWYSAHSSTISEIISQYSCTKATNLVQTVEAYETCPAVSGIIANGMTASPTTSSPRGPAQTDAPTTPTGQDGNGSLSTSTTAPPAAAPPNRALRAGMDRTAVAVAGLVGFAGLIAAL